MSVLGDRLDALAAALAAAWPERVVTRSFRDFSLRDQADLEDGVYTLIANGESFESGLQRDELMGEQRLILIAQGQVAEDAEPAAVEELELTFVDEIKAFLEVLPAGLCGLELQGYRQSAQIEHPYGWVAFELTYADYD